MALSKSIDGLSKIVDLREKLNGTTNCLRDTPDQIGVECSQKG